VTRRPAKQKARKTRSPGDYEAELVRLCKGNRIEANRLIVEEVEKSPGLSRQGAALALVANLRLAPTALETGRRVASPRHLPGYVRRSSARR
jgi:hypothetical protein